MPTAFFAVHLMNFGSDEASRQHARPTLTRCAKWCTPQKEAVFAGVGELEESIFPGWGDRQGRESPGG